MKETGRDISLEKSAPARIPSEKLPSTKEVLSEHVYAVVSQQVPDMADKVTGMLMECSISSLTSLLADEQLMEKRISQAVDALKRSGLPVSKGLTEEKKKYGDSLFEKVAELESELSAQITGMLLEMSESNIKRLLEDPVYLETSVTTARMEYLQTHHPGCLPTKEELGEEVYETVVQTHPEHCARITGMLMELSLEELQRLVENPSLLKTRVEQAYNAIKESSQT